MATPQILRGTLYLANPLSGRSSPTPRCRPHLPRTPGCSGRARAFQMCTPRRRMPCTSANLQDTSGPIPAMPWRLLRVRAMAVHLGRKRGRGRGRHGAGLRDPALHRRSRQLQPRGPVPDHGRWARCHEPPAEAAGNDRIAGLQICPLEIGRGPFTFVIHGRSRSVAPSRRPEDPCQDLGRRVQQSRILNR